MFGGGSMGYGSIGGNAKEDKPYKNYFHLINGHISMPADSRYCFKMAEKSQKYQ